MAYACKINMTCVCVLVNPVFIVFETTTTSAATGFCVEKYWAVCRFRLFSVVDTQYVLVFYRAGLNLCSF